MNVLLYFEQQLLQNITPIKMRQAFGKVYENTVLPFIRQIMGKAERVGKLDRLGDLW